MIECSGSMWRRSPAPTGRFYTPYFTLSLFSQPARGGCMGSDCTKSECALTALEPQQELLHSRPVENSRQSGPAKKCFWRDVTPLSGAQNSSTTKTICFSLNKGQCFRHPKPSDWQHKCIIVSRANPSYAKRVW